MYALFDDAGKFHAGRVMSEAENSLQIELDSGKRVKVKSANVMLKFEQPAPAELIAQAQLIAQQIDLDLAWEFASADEFSFVDLARDYFDAKAGPDKQAAALFRLFEAPHYFRRTGKGMFKKAPEEIVKAALLGIERKKKQLEQIELWASELMQGQCPASVREQLYRILFKPDKNAPEYKAVVEAARRSQRAPLDLLKAAGAIDSEYQFHWRRFLFEQFPKGTGFAPLAAPAIKDALPLAEVQAFSIDDSSTTEIDDALSVRGIGSGTVIMGIHIAAPPIKDALPVAAVQAFSIDDSSTTEIDDALSVQGLGSGTVVLGVHIAAPGLAFATGSEIDKVASQRLSTVYMPGWKLTMLPDAVVEAYTLVEGRDCPAVSLYVSFDEATLDVEGHETKLDRKSVV